MTQKLEARNPYEIRIPTHLEIDEAAVTKVVSRFQADGIIPDIIVTESGELIEGIEAIEAAKRLDQQMVMVAVRPPLQVSESLLTSISAELLYVHPLNASIYGDKEDLSYLKSAIASTGWIKPLVATPDGQERYRIVSGNSCFKVGCELGRKEFSVELKIFNSEQEELKTLLAGNVGREKTIEQKVREGLLWEKIEREEAKARQGRAGAGQGTTRDVIAKLVGLGSGVNYEHAVAAVREMDESKDAPSGSVQHHRHQQFKQLLSRPRGVDAAYKLVKESAPPSAGTNHSRWTPKEFERVKITGGTHKGSIATVRVITGPFSSICHIDGTPENKREQVPFNQMEAMSQAAPPTSVKQELKQKQQAAGFGKGEQLFKESDRNEGHSPEQQLSASITNINAIGEVQVTEMAIALLSLTSKQLFEVMSKARPDFSTSQLEAIWKALEKSLAHKAA
ncbi:hypothetical protein [Nostoc sp. TCL240-02]|uniref:hypothetical protein n=1 Tax=Nostoc sp. TCL240-02 TaxID=2572090 RepID=UPI00157FBBFB|nr:hypothetical protein [Nostoc sp. TCL240-02]QKQ75570.1 hypothetical protein FBB35_21805 [Nostoc sp. TCL240-02]